MASNLGSVGSNGIAAAQSAVASLRSEAPTQNARIDFQNAVKALAQADKSNTLKDANAAVAEARQAQRRVPERQQAPAAETRQLQQDGQARQARQRENQDFLTRQDLLAAAVSPGRQTGIGRNIDIEV